MEDLKEFLITFIGLKEGKHLFEYNIDGKFFEFFKYDEFEKANIKVTLEFEKKHNMIQLEFSSNGFIGLLCDVSGEPFELELDSALSLIVKFGDVFNNDNEEILILPHGEYELNVAQYIYEMIVLSVPVKRVHPGIENGTLKTDVIDKLEKYKEQKETIDPRWEKLKELKTKNKSNNNGTS